MAEATVPAPAVVRVERMGSVAVLILDAGTDNVLRAGVQAALLAALDAAVADPSVTAVVLTGEGGRFATGEDAGAQGGAPALGDVCQRIEAAARPVVAALHGAVLDGALELALAASARVAEAGARLGFPAVRTGLSPGAGGTQRLPRLVGVAAALDLLVSGRSVAAAEALALGLVDRVVEGQDALLLAALDLASDLAGLPAPPPGGRGTGLRHLSAQMAAVAAARAAVRDAPVEAPRRIVDCVEAALLLPFAQGLDFEAAARADLLAAPAHAALRAIARAEARLDAAEGGPLPQDAVVIGAAGADFACDLLAAGLSVTLVEPDRPALIAALERIAAAQGAAAAEGRMTEAARDADWARLTPAQAAPEATECLVLAGAGGPSVAADLTIRLGQAPGPGVTGLVLHRGGLAEVLVGDGIAQAVTARVAALARRTGRVALPVGRTGVVAPMRAALEAVSAHEAARAGGPTVEAALSGLGLAVDGLPPGGVSEAAGSVRSRVLAALANAGLRLIGAGVLDRPDDVDVALVHGMGFLRHIPGPMLWAAQRGLLVLRADLRRWELEAPPIWTPAPLIDVMIRRGTRIADLED